MASLLPQPRQAQARRNGRIFHLWLWALALTSLAVDLTAAQTKPKPQPQQRSETLSTLQARIEKQLSKPQFSSAVWGIKVVSLETGLTLYEHNPRKLLNPASNAKLLTGALALDQLGPDYRIQTSLFATSRPSSKGTLKGDLVLYGRGDPCFSPNFSPTAPNSLLTPLLQLVATTGIKRIQGDLIADESFFTGASLGSGWAWDDLPYGYGAEVSSLTFHDNISVMRLAPADRIGAPCKISFNPLYPFDELINRTKTSPKGIASTIRWDRSPGQNFIIISGELPLDSPGYAASVSVPQPASLFLRHFYDSLIARGIKITGKPRLLSAKESTRTRWTDAIELGATQSRPVGEITEKMLKGSQNLYAQLLLLQVGEKHRSLITPLLTAKASSSLALASMAQNASKVPLKTSEAMGLEALQIFLGKAGIDARQFFLEEGAGLSRASLASADAMVTLLRFMERHPHRETFRRALPVAGIDGTLRNRLRHASTQGNLRAKTGSMRFVESLSGYVTTSGKEPLAFSVLLNNYHPSPAGRSAREEVDTLALFLAEFTGHSRNSPPRKRSAKR